MLLYLNQQNIPAQSDDFLDEKFAEIQSWKDNDVFDELPFNESMKPLGTRWVLTVKPDGRRKARLVAKGFQDTEVDSLIKDSPTCSKETFRIAVAVFASNNKWNTAKALDVKTAFLQGVPLKRDVYISPPKDMFPNSNFTWKLKKCVYGLADASRYWYDRVLHEFEALGGRRSTFDYALFIWKNDGCICTHVDDFWILGTSEFVEKMELNLSRIFHIGTVLSVPFNYLGLKIEQWDDRVILDLANPLGDLAEIEIPRDRIQDKTNSINEQERYSLRSTLGKLLWPAMQTRPDILFTAASMASKIPHATIFDLLNTNKLIRRVKHENTVLKFPRFNNVSNLSIFCFTDASFNNNVDGSTQGGYLVFLVDNNTMDSALIAWQSRKLKRVARSTLMAETFACIEGIDCSLLCAKILGDLTNVDNVKVYCYTDNSSLIESIYSTKYVSDKRLRLEIGYLKEIVAKEGVLMRWISTDKQLADCMTKERSNTKDRMKRAMDLCSLKGIDN